MSNTGNKLPEKKKNDLLKKFLNAQEYTKTLKVFLENIDKKSAMNVVQDSSYGGYSYDEMQSYPQIPQSAKLPSTKQFSYRDRMFSNDLIYSFESMNINQSRDFTSKPKIKKSHHGYNNMTQSSNQIPYMKSKKSSYSQIDKSQSIPRTITADNPVPIKVKDYQVLSMNKEKYTSQAMHESLGAMKTDSFFKPKTKKSFNYSNLHEYESQKLSVEDEHSFQKLRKTQQQKPFFTPPQQKQLYPYNLSSSNFLKLINKVQELESVIMMYQEAVKLLKKKIINLETQNKANKMQKIYVDTIKEELLQQKNKNSQLREKIGLQETYLKQYEQTIIESVQKIGNFYQTEIAKITILQKQNKFLKFMLRLEIQNQDSNIEGNQLQNGKQHQNEENQPSTKNKIEITKNLGNFKQKFTNLLQNKKLNKI